MSLGQVAIGYECKVGARDQCGKSNKYESESESECKSRLTLSWGAAGDRGSRGPSPMGAFVLAALAEARDGRSDDGNQAAGISWAVGDQNCLEGGGGGVGVGECWR